MLPRTPILEPEDRTIPSDAASEADSPSSPAEAGVDASTCLNACTSGDTQCAVGGVETCVAPAHGCAVWSMPVPCPPAMPVCNAGVCGCQNGTTRCQFNGVQACVDGTWGNVVACDPTTPSCNDGVCGQPASCQTPTNGTTNCGPGGSGGESCCTSLEVPGGTYDRNYDIVDGGATNLSDPATVSGFRLDKYLVTVGRFRQFVNYVLDGGALPANGSGKHTYLNDGGGLVNSGNDGGLPYETGWNTDWNQPSPLAGPYIPAKASDWNLDLGGAAATADAARYRGPGGGFSTWTPTVADQESKPINVITWYEAYAFCIWDGGFLPSEAEWEYAAAGGSQQRVYPWGSTDPGTNYLYSISGDGVTPNTSCYYPSVGPCTGAVNIAPRGNGDIGHRVLGPA